MRNLALALAALLLLALPARAQAPSPSPSPSPRVPYRPVVQEIPVPEDIHLPPAEGVVPEAATRPLSAEEAAQIALSCSPDLVAARANVRAADGRVQQALAGLVPQLKLTGNYSEDLLDDVWGLVAAPAAGSATGSAAALAGAARGATTAGGSQYSAGASLSQLLTDFGYTRSRVQQAQALRRAAGAGLSRAQADVVIAVKQAYYQFVQASRLVEVAAMNLANQQEHLRQAQGRFRSGIGLAADVTRAETAVSAAVFSLTQARANANVSRVNLALSMGIDPRTPLEAGSSDEPALDDSQPQALFDLAMRLRPELRQAQANIEAGEAGVAVARSSDAPALAASLGYSRFGQASFELDTLMATVALQWQAYDGGAADGRVVEAQAGLDTAQAQRMGLEQRIQAEVARAWLTLTAARQALETARSQEISARETQRLANGRYRVGLGIFLDVLDAQQALVSAETNRVNAETALALARANLNYAVGQPLADQGPRLDCKGCLEKAPAGGPSPAPDGSRPPEEPSGPRGAAPTRSQQAAPPAAPAGPGGGTQSAPPGMEEAPPGRANIP